MQYVYCQKNLSETSVNNTIAGISAIKHDRNDSYITWFTRRDNMYLKGIVT